MTSMAAGKHISFFCIAVTVLTIILTLLFMNGEAIGITAITDGDSGDKQFTENDRLTDWADSDATRIVLTGSGADISGNGAYADGGSVHIVYAGKYVITGQLENGSLIIDADKDDKIWLLLDNVNLYCEDNASLLVEQAEKVFLTLADGSENVISSGAEYSETAVSSKIDGAVYSRDDLTINGNGRLSVKTGYQHAVVCNDDLVVTGGTISLEAPQDGIHANDSARIADADITINAGDDGITVSNDDETGYIYIESGTVSIPSCYEGMEAVNITITGGTIDIVSTDDGINANGTGIGTLIDISGGNIRIVNPSGRDADGLDSNGSIVISGGNLLISVNGNGSNSALDSGTESGGTCKISGGTVIAAGGSSMAGSFDSSSEQCFITHVSDTLPDGTAITLKNDAGETLLSETIPCSFSMLILSSPELSLGDTCTLLTDGEETEITIDNSVPAGTFGRGGMRGMGDMRGMGEIQDGMDLGGRTRGEYPQGGPPEEAEMPERMDFQEEAERPEEIDSLEGAERPEGTDFQEKAERPEGTDFQGRAGRMGFPGRTEPQEEMEPQTSQVSAEAIALTGVSVLLLIIGLVIAYKQKSRW